MLSSSATLSACGNYRYTLARMWKKRGPVVMFVGLNPSTADKSADDPTVRRCVSFGRQWGFSGLLLTNLFAYRSTEPGVLNCVADPIGPDNDYWIVELSRSAKLTIAAWGVHGSLLERDKSVLAKLNAPHCLCTTKDGAPRHPLYLRADTVVQRFR